MSSLIARLGLNTAQFDRQLRGVTTRLKSAAGAFGIGFSAASVAVVTRSVSKYAEQIDRAALLTGASREEFQKLAHAVNQAKGNTDDLVKGMQELAVRAGRQPELFSKWGISLRDSNGSMLGTSELLMQVADRMQAAASPATRLALAQDLMSESGRRLVPTMQQGSAAIAETGKQIATMSDQSIAAIARLNDSISKVKLDAMARIGNVLGGIMNPSGSFLPAAEFGGLAAKISAALAKGIASGIGLLGFGIVSAWSIGERAMLNSADRFIRFIKGGLSGLSIGGMRPFAGFEPDTGPLKGDRDYEADLLRRQNSVTDPFSEFNRWVDGLTRKMDASLQQMRSEENLQAPTAKVGSAIDDLAAKIEAGGSKVDKSLEKLKADLDKARSELTQLQFQKAESGRMELQELADILKPEDRIREIEVKLRRDKMSIGEIGELERELRGLRDSTFFKPLDKEVRRDSLDAREALEFRRQAEEARLRGDQVGFADKSERALQIEQRLVDKGAVRETEGVRLKNALTETESQLRQIEANTRAAADAAKAKAPESGKPDASKPAPAPAPTPEKKAPSGGRFEFKDGELRRERTGPETKAVRDEQGFLRRVNVEVEPEVKAPAPVEVETVQPPPVEVDTEKVRSGWQRAIDALTFRKLRASGEVDRPVAAAKTAAAAVATAAVGPKIQAIMTAPETADRAVDAITMRKLRDELAGRRDDKSSPMPRDEFQRRMKARMEAEQPPPVGIEVRQPDTVAVTVEKPAPVVVDINAPDPVKVEAKAPAPVEVDVRKPAPVAVESIQPASVTIDVKRPDSVAAEVEPIAPVRVDTIAPDPVRISTVAPEPVKVDVVKPEPVKVDVQPRGSDGVQPPFQSTPQRDSYRDTGFDSDGFFRRLGIESPSLPPAESRGAAEKARIRIDPISTTIKQAEKMPVSPDVKTQQAFRSAGEAALAEIARRAASIDSKLSGKLVAQ